MLWSLSSFAQYCVSGGPSSVFDSNVQSVTLTGNISSINYTGCPGVTGVEDLTATQSADLAVGGTYTGSIQFGTCGGNFGGAGEAWIDWNGDGTFAASESVATWTGTPPATPTALNITVPATAVVGVTRMRVMQRESGSLPLNPCASFTWGSVVDFSINVTATGSGAYCTAIGPSSVFDSNVQSVSLTGNTVDINYTGCPGVTGLEDLTATQQADLSPGQTYTGSIQFGTCGGNFGGAGEAWIDWNQNGTFEPTESVATWTGTPPAAATALNITVPTGIAPGARRMRVIQQESGSLPINPCASFTWGSAVDFTITVGPVPVLCTAVGPSSTADSNVESVTFNGLSSNISYTGCSGSSGVAGLDDQTATQIADLEAGSTYSGTIQFGTCGGNFSGAGEAWIDWNGNLDFEPSESVATWSGTPPAAPTNFTVTVPAGVTSQDTIVMRVIQQEGGTLPLDPCASFTWGSAADFSIVLIPLPTYCGGGASSVFDSNVESVNMAGNTSSIAYTGCSGSSGPTGLDDQTATQVADLSLGVAYPLTVQFGTCGGNFSGAGEVWIDWNRDGTFAPSESIGTWSGTPPVAASNFTVNVPVTATPGFTRMRVMQREGGTLPLDPCASFTWGSKVDVGINIVTTAVSCPNPSAVTVANLTGNSAEVSWTTGGSAVSTAIVVGAPGFSPAAATPIAATSNPFTVTGLSPNTSYEVYVQENCGAGNGQSAWIGPIAFTTPCASFPAPFVENFNASSTPACWSESGSESWRYTTTAGYAAAGAGDHTGNGGNYAWIDGSFPNGSSQVSTLTSPLVDVSTLISPEFRFWVFSLNTNDPTSYNTLTVEFYDGAAWNNVYTLQGSPSTTWHEVVIDLTTFTITGDVQVRFTIAENAPGSPFFNDILIDDVTIDEKPVCGPSTNIVVSNITTTAADISWVDTTTAVNVDIEYGLAGFTPGTGTVITGVTSPLSLSGLNPAQTYDFYLNTTCSNSGTSSAVSSFTTDCPPIPGDSVAAAVVVNTTSFTDSANTSLCYTDRIGNAAPDVFYRVELDPCAISLDVSLCGSLYDTYLHVLDASLNSLAVNDDACGLQSEITGLSVTGGTVVYVVVEGFSSESGIYEVAINQTLNSASISLPATEYCPSEPDPTFTVTGQTGGTFSEATGNVVVDATTGTVDLDASTNGTYAIDYTYNDPATGCTITASSTIIIRPENFADISYASSSYCFASANPTAIIHSLTPGTFSSSDSSNFIVDAATGTIDIAASTGGSYEVYFTTNTACPQTDTFAITIGDSTTATLNETVCSSYDLNGQIYTSSGTYTQTIANGVGCDSVITLNLTINATTASLNQTACQSFDLNGQTYTSSGTYVQTLTNSVGCDSILTLTLLLEDIDTSITQNGLTLVANEAGASYQWLDCDNSFAPIPFATTRVYGGNLSNVAVAITKNGCTDTSSCYQLGNPFVAVTELEAGAIRYYPNPSDGLLNIEWEGSYEALRVEVLSPLGQVLQSYEPGATDRIQIELPREAGWYMIRMHSEDSEYSFRVIRRDQ